MILPHFCGIFISIVDGFMGKNDVQKLMLQKHGDDLNIALAAAILLALACAICGERVRKKSRSPTPVPQVAFTHLISSDKTP